MLATTPLHREPVHVLEDRRADPTNDTLEPTGERTHVY